jgi:hypothetical protein
LVTAVTVVTYTSNNCPAFGALIIAVISLYNVSFATTATGRATSSTFVTTYTSATTATATCSGFGAGFFTATIDAKATTVEGSEVAGTASADLEHGHSNPSQLLIHMRVVITGRVTASTEQVVVAQAAAHAHSL